MERGLDEIGFDGHPQKGASNGKFLSGRTDMTLRFLAIDPDTNGETGHERGELPCPVPGR
jgi:hypothetical protein